MMYKSQFHKIDPYDWFCGPGSQIILICWFGDLLEIFCYIITVFNAALLNTSIHFFQKTKSCCPQMFEQ